MEKTNASTDTNISNIQGQSRSDCPFLFYIFRKNPHKKHLVRVCNLAVLSPSRGAIFEFRKIIFEQPENFVQIFP
jgi:hypothetical protein